MLSIACGDGRAPPPGRFDASFDATPALDAAGDDAAFDAARPDDPRLPAADLEVVLPYRGPEATVELRVRAELGRLDVQLSVDTTGSFGGEIDAMQDDLQDRIIPALEARVEDVAFGVNRFEDFPSAPFGEASDRPFFLHTAITTDGRRAASAVAALDSPLGLGGDLPESGFEALYQIATGEGYSLGGRDLVAPFRGEGPAGGSIGGVGFRDGALRAVVHITDAPSHVPGDYAFDYPGTHGLDEAVAALRANQIRVLGIASAEISRFDLEPIALATGATVPPADGECATGIDGDPRAPVGGVCPLVFDILGDGTGLSDAVIDALAELVNSVRFTEVHGVAIDDRLRFVRVIEATEANPPPGVAPPERTDERPMDSIDDTFRNVGPATELVFVARLHNATVPPADYDQIFRVAIEIRGDGLTLTERVVRIIVPFGRLSRDAGLDAGTDV